jgi:Tfp pilus assembly protein PilF
MKTPCLGAGGLAAAVLLLAFAGAAAEEPGEKKGFWNRLRGGEPKQEEAAPAPQQAPVETPPPAGPAPGYDVKKLEGSMERIERSILGAEASVKAYLEMIGSGQASSTQLNDFAAFLLRRGVPNLAVDFQHAATEVSPDVPALWVNLGTIEQARGKSGSAKTAYKKALDLDPTNGMAYYGLGVVADASREYEEAIEYYRRALLIDPSLADPKVNPQVVNNERLLVVKLLLSRDRAGAMSLPLLPPGR